MLASGDESYRAALAEARKNLAANSTPIRVSGKKKISERELGSSYKVSQCDYKLD